MTVLDLGSAASLAAGVDTPNNAAVTSADRLIVEGDAVDSEGNNSVEDHLAELYNGVAHEEAFRWTQLGGPRAAPNAQSGNFRLSFTAARSAAVRRLVEGTLAVGKFRVRVELDASRDHVVLADLIPPQVAVGRTVGFQAEGILSAVDGPWMIRLVSPGSASTPATVYIEFWPIGLHSSALIFTHSPWPVTNLVYLDYRRHP